MTFWRYHAQPATSELPADQVTPALRQLHAALVRLTPVESEPSQLRGGTERCAFPSYRSGRLAGTHYSGPRSAGEHVRSIAWEAGRDGI
jgi:hypothetical protein